MGLGGWWIGAWGDGVAGVGGGVFLRVAECQMSQAKSEGDTKGERESIHTFPTFPMNVARMLMETQPTKKQKMVSSSVTGGFMGDAMPIMAENPQ